RSLARAHGHQRRCFHTHVVQARAPGEDHELEGLELVACGREAHLPADLAGVGPVPPGGGYLGDPHRERGFGVRALDRGVEACGREEVLEDTTGVEERAYR